MVGTKLWTVASFIVQILAVLPLAYHLSTLQLHDQLGFGVDRLETLKTNLLALDETLNQTNFREHMRIELTLVDVEQGTCGFMADETTNNQWLVAHFRRSQFQQV